MCVQLIMFQIHRHGDRNYDEVGLPPAFKNVPPVGVGQLTKVLKHVSPLKSAYLRNQ